MSADKACRVCLVRNRNLYRVRNDLQHIYESLTREEYNKDGYPVLMCCICLSVLRKCHRFMETARDSNIVLKQWHNQLNEIEVAKPLITYSVKKQDSISLGHDPVFSEDFRTESVDMKQVDLDLGFEIPIEMDLKLDLNFKDEMDSVLGCLDYVKVVMKETEDVEQTHRSELLKNHDDTFLNLDSTDTKGETSLSCEVCNYQCAQQWVLARHMKTHFGEKHFSCNVCDYKCLNKNDYTRHMRTHTGEKPFACNVCSYKCAHKWSLIRHLKTHTGEKPFSCTYCEYKCSAQHLLTIHTRTHTGEKPYACDVCSYKCANSNDLTKHNKIHTGEKPYSCTLCKYKSSRKDCLKAHMKTHSGEKPFSCTTCGYKFSQKRNLITHMRVHTGEKPFTCKLCDYKCARKNNLNAHMKTHHEKAKENPEPKPDASHGNVNSTGANLDVSLPPFMTK